MRLQRENDALAAVATESVDQAARDASLAAQLIRPSSLRHGLRQG